MVVRDPVSLDESLEELGADELEADEPEGSCDAEPCCEPDAELALCDELSADVADDAADDAVPDAALSVVSELSEPTELFESVELVAFQGCRIAKVAPPAASATIRRPMTMPLMGDLFFRRTGG